MIEIIEDINVTIDGTTLLVGDVDHLPYTIKIKVDDYGEINAILELETYLANYDTIRDYPSSYTNIPKDYHELVNTLNEYYRTAFAVLENTIESYNEPYLAFQQ